MPRKSAAYLLLVLVMAGFSGYGVILQLYGHRGVDASVLSAMRDTLAFPVLLGAGWFLEGYRVPTARESMAIALLALFGIFGNQIFFILGLYQTNATLASLIQQTIPVLTAGVAILTGQEPTPTFADASGWLRIGGMATAAAGAATIITSTNKGGIGPKSNEQVAGHLAGELLLLMNCLCMTTYMLLQKYLLSDGLPPHRKPWRSVAQKTTATDLCRSLNSPDSFNSGSRQPLLSGTTGSKRAASESACWGADGSSIDCSMERAAGAKLGAETGPGHVGADASAFEPNVSISMASGNISIGVAKGNLSKAKSKDLACGQDAYGQLSGAPPRCGAASCGQGDNKCCGGSCTDSKGCHAKKDCQTSVPGSKGCHITKGGCRSATSCGTAGAWAGLLATWRGQPVTLTAWTYFFGMIYMLINVLALYIWFPMYSPDKVRREPYSTRARRYIRTNHYGMRFVLIQRGRP
eukprot:jgi/Mesvir1/13382/Mv15052-RA.3